MHAKWVAATAVGALLVLGVTCREARGCDCAWGGPFLTVAPRAAAVVRGVVVAHQGQTRVGPASMDVRVAETLSGDVGQTVIRVWGGDGAMCRPNVSQFPPGTAWLIALNGPGSKPGMTPDYAVSNCGAYWLRVERDEVVGNVDDLGRMDAVQRLPLTEFKKRFAAMQAGLTPRRETFGGTIAAGQRFERAFGDNLRFVLEPAKDGWLIEVRRGESPEDLARLTPPLHFSPNPRLIEAWHFADADRARDGNAPGETREFIFSAKINRSIDGPDAKRPPTPGEIKAIAADGSGLLKIVDARVSRPDPTQPPRFESLHFYVELTWRPAAFAARR